MSLWNSSLSVKLIICLTGSLVIISSLLGRQSIELHRRHLEDMTHRSADALSEIIKGSTRYSMLKNHREDLYQIIKTIGSNPRIGKVRLFNKDGIIRFSSDDTEVDTAVNKSAESCYKCHAQEEPLRRLDRPDRVRTYTMATGERVLGVINPVENEPSCYNASCHAHDSGQQVLGVLDVILPLAEVDKTIRAGEKLVVFNVLAAIVVLCGIVGALVWGMVHRPVKKLYEGMRRVAAGDLEHKIEVASQDEIGQLATSFNRMTDALKKANDELRDWTQNLETRVEEKTHQLNEAHEHVIRVERMASMGKLAAIVAHEINNPLTAVLTSARFLLRKLARNTMTEDGGKAVKDHLELIAGESARCGEIVKDLLQFTRQSKGHYEAASVKELLMDSLRLVQHKIDLMGLRVKTEIQGEIPPVLCNPREIKQTLVAILINASEAMSDTAGLLEAGGRHRADDSMVEIWVRDNGRGMDEQSRKRLFEPFFTTKEEGGSVGLGLTVARSIVDRHSGGIWVESTPGKGTTVLITLPVFSRDASSTGTEQRRET